MLLCACLAWNQARSLYATHKQLVPLEVCVIICLQKVTKWTLCIRLRWLTCDQRVEAKNSLIWEHFQMCGILLMRASAGCLMVCGWDSHTLEALFSSVLARTNLALVGLQLNFCLLQWLRESWNFRGASICRFLGENIFRHIFWLAKKWFWC